MRKLLPLVRLAAYIVVCALALGYIDYRVARASVVERLLSFGTRMAPYLDDLNASEAPRRVFINGMEMRVSTGHTKQPASRVRDWYADRYAETGQAAAAITSTLTKKGRAVTQPLNEFWFGDEKRGGMLAMDLGGKLTTRELKARLDNVAKTGEIGDLGQMRYLYYERTADGGTRYLTAWTQNALQLDKLGSKGDVGGQDPGGIPRYPGFVRTLVAHEQGMPQKIYAFEGAGQKDVVEMFYRSRLAALGWQEDSRFTKLAADRGRSSLRFENSRGQELVLDVETNGDRVNLCVITSAPPT